MKIVCYTAAMFNNERFSFKMLSVLSLTFKPSSRYSPKREYNVLVFRKSGLADLTHAQQTHTLTKNNVTFIPKGYDYTITTKTNEEVVVIHFDGDIENGKEFKNLNSNRPEILCSLFEDCFNTWTKKPIGFVYKLDSLFLAILQQLECQSVEKYSSLLELSIQRAVDEMHLQISNADLSIDQLAQYTGYAPSYFRRAFKRFMGKSPIEYLIDIRIEYATSLLQSGYYTVDKTAVLCGFESTKYFSTFYKSRTGVSPSKMLPTYKK